MINSPFEAIEVVPPPPFSFFLSFTPLSSIHLNLALADQPEGCSDSSLPDQTSSSISTSPQIDFGLDDLAADLSRITIGNQIQIHQYQSEVHPL